MNRIGPEKKSIRKQSKVGGESLYLSVQCVEHGFQFKFSQTRDRNLGFSIPRVLSLVMQLRTDYFIRNVILFLLRQSVGAS